MNDTDVGALQGVECKSTVARWPAGRSVVHAGVTSLNKTWRTNVSAEFSRDGGTRRGR